MKECAGKGEEWNKPLGRLVDDVDTPEAVNAARSRFRSTPSTKSKDKDQFRRKVREAWQATMPSYAETDLLDSCDCYCDLDKVSSSWMGEVRSCAASRISMTAGSNVVLL